MKLQKENEERKVASFDVQLNFCVVRIVKRQGKLCTVTMAATENDKHFISECCRQHLCY